MATFYYEMAIGNAGHSLAKFEYITRTGKYQYSASGEIKEDLIYKESSNMPSWASGKTDGGYDMKSATFKDAAGNTTVTNGNGMTITPGSANPNNPNAGPVFFN